MKKGFTYLTGLILRSFLQGLLIIGPIAATISVIWYVFSKIDNIIPTISQKSPGIVFLSVIGFTTIIGFLGTKLFVGRWLVDVFDNLMEKTPGIKFIYTSIKDMLNSFVGDKKKFSNPVWVKTNNDPEIWRIGFLTQEDMNTTQMAGKVSVYMPHSYAISGWVIIVDLNNTKPVVSMTPAAAMKFAISGGISGFKDEQINN